MSSTSTPTALATALALATAERDTAHQAREETTTAIMAARARRDSTAADLAQLQAAVRDGDTTVTAEQHQATQAAAQFAQLQFEGAERAHAGAVAAHTDADAATVAAEVAHEIATKHPASRVAELRATAVAALTELVTTARGRNAALREANGRLEAAGWPEHRPLYSGRLEVKVEGTIHEGTPSVDELPATIADEVRTALRR